MKTTWSWWGRLEIGVVLSTPWNCLCKCNHFRGVFATRVLRVYYVEMLRRLAHDLRDPTAFSPRSRSDRRTVAFVLSMLKTNALTRRSLATMATTARCLTFLPRFYHVSTTFLPRLYHVSTTFLPRFYHVSTTFLSTTFLPRLWRPWRALDPFSVAVDAQ